MDNAKLAIYHCHKLIYETGDLCKYLNDIEMSITKRSLQSLSPKKDQATKDSIENSYVTKRENLNKQISKKEENSLSNKIHTYKSRESELTSKINLTDELSSDGTSHIEENNVIIDKIISIYSPILVELARRLSNYETRLKRLDGEIKPDPTPLLSGILPNGKIDEMKRSKQYKISSRNLLGLKANDDWITNINIGNVMHLLPLSLEDLMVSPQIGHEICKDALYEKMIMTTIAYFSIATECRFLSNLENKEFYQGESKYWHKAAVELVCTFLPNTCPLVSHIVSSYEKHNSLAQEVIVINYKL